MAHKDDPDNERIPLLHLAFPRVRPPTAEILEEFVTEHDIEVKQGKFSTKEDLRIERNFRKFCKAYDLEDCSITRCALLGFTVIDEEQIDEFRRIKCILKQSGFYYLMARKLPKRLISAVYNRARKLLHPFRKLNELTESERCEIVELAKQKEKWQGCHRMFAEIANIYKCCPRAVQRIVEYRVDRDKNRDFSKGRWEMSETVKLIQILLDYYEINIDQLTEEHLLKDIPWTELSKKVGNRGPDACFSHLRRIAAHLGYTKREYKAWVDGSRYCK